MMSIAATRTGVSILPHSAPLDSPGASSSSDDTSVDIDLDDLVEASTPTRSSSRTQGRTHGSSTSISNRAQLAAGLDHASSQTQAARHRQAASLSARVHIRVPSRTPALGKHRKSQSLYGERYKQTLSGFLVRSYRRASLGERLAKLLFIACVLVFASALCGVGHDDTEQQPQKVEHSHLFAEEHVPVPGTALLAARQQAEMEQDESSTAQQKRIAQIAIHQQEYARGSRRYFGKAEEVSGGDLGEGEEESRNQFGRQAAVEVTEDELRALDHSASETLHEHEPVAKPVQQPKDPRTEVQEEQSREEEVQSAEQIERETAIEAREEEAAAEAEEVDQSSEQQQQPEIEVVARRNVPLAAMNRAKAAAHKPHHDEDIFEQHLAAQKP